MPPLEKGNTMWQSGCWRLVVLAGAFLLASSVQAVTPGNATYTYDGVGRIIAVIYEDGTGQVYTYDPAGNRQNSYSGPLPVLGITSSASVAEGGSVTLTVTRTSQSPIATSITYQTIDGSAVAGTNYTSASGTLNFLATDTAKTITIATINDGRYDGPISFNVKISPASANVAALSPSSAVVTINDATAAPSFAIGTPAPVAEGNTVNFTVTRTGTTSLTQAVSYATANNTAVAGTDYTAGAGTLTFAPATTSQTFSVPTAHRINYEGTRSFTATLSNPGNGAVIGTGSATEIITDIDTAISFAINSPTVNEGSPVIFTVSVNGGPAGIPFTVNYATANGTALAGTDYTAASGTLTFPVGTISQAVSIATNGNAHGDTATRNFTVTLSNASNSAPIGTSVGTGGIKSINVPAAPVLSPSYTYKTDVGYSLNWTAPAGNPTSYQLWGSTDSKPTPALKYSGTALSYSTSLGGTNTYYFYVQACNANGCGAQSNQAVVAICLNGNC